jgi:isopentenyl diphosphate isomerase/L-lactate dehydrogenase-like FMN-dependent dehydrogenase
MQGVFNLDDFEPLARDSLDPAAYAYFAGGSGDEVTLAENVAAFARRRLRPRVLVDVSGVDPATAFLGTEVSMPVGLAPNAQQGLAHPEGEVATAGAAADRGVLMCLSTIATRSLEEVAEASMGARWFQLYFHRDREVTQELVTRAEAAGYGAIVVTADLPVPGYRERELRTPVRFGDAYPFGNFRGVETAGEELLVLIADITNASVTWDDLDWLRDHTRLPVLVKGILTAEDARLAAQRGAAGIVVSNHGGRQLDRVPATIDVLEEVVEAAGAEMEVYLDGGVRRGTDVVVALALGARGVFIGRPYLFALAAAGQKGVEHALDLVRAEVLNAMALLGVTRPDEIRRSHVV